MKLMETYFLTSVVIYLKSVKLGASTEHFTTIDDYEVSTLPMQNTVSV